MKPNDCTMTSNTSPLSVPENIVSRRSRRPAADSPVVSTTKSARSRRPDSISRSFSMAAVMDMPFSISGCLRRVSL